MRLSALKRRVASNSRGVRRAPSTPAYSPRAASMANGVEKAGTRSDEQSSSPLATTAWPMWIT